jgi:hypothetical protein
MRRVASLAPLVLLVAVALVAVGAPFSQAAAGTTRPSSRERTIGVVGGGSGNHRWSVRLGVKDGRKNAPCLSSVIAGGGKLTVCGLVDHPYPLVVAAGYGEGKARSTAIGIASARNARTAEARLGTGGVRRIRMKPVGHFTIGGFVLSGGSPCVRRLVLRSGSGALVGAPGQGFCNEK